MYVNIFSTPLVRKNQEYIQKNWLKIIGGSEVTYTMIPLTVYQVRKRREEMKVVTPLTCFRSRRPRHSTS